MLLKTLLNNMSSFKHPTGTDSVDEMLTCQHVSTTCHCVRTFKARLSVASLWLLSGVSVTKRPGHSRFFAAELDWLCSKGCQFRGNLNSMVFPGCGFASNRSIPIFSYPFRPAISSPIFSHSRQSTWVKNWRELILMIPKRTINLSKIARLVSMRLGWRTDRTVFCQAGVHVESFPGKKLDQVF